VDHLYLYILAAVIITFIPLLKSLFGTVHTLVHESGHAIASLLTSGKVYSISLYRTTEGVAYTSSRSWVSSVIVTYAGYTFASVVSVLSFYLIAEGHVLVLFYSFLGLAIINLLLWVRNFYGVIWLLFFIGSCVLLMYFQLRLVKEIVVYFLSSIVLVHSLLASITIFLLSMSNRQNAGDAYGLQKLTYIPAFVWGFLFFFQSVSSAYYIFRFFIS
jgi:hypothetical protein